VDRERLERRFEATFDGSEEARAVVARQARDLSDSGRIEADFGYELTVDDVVGHLADAPDDYSLVERWNWWVGALDVTHPGYDRFVVRIDVR
jgi:hypothetical protein